MKLDFKFAVVSDLHIALPHTIWNAPNRFHLVEVSIPAFEQILERLIAERPDFLLLPGDLVQHGERENHEWMVQRLSELPFPSYVVPGNHDVVSLHGSLDCDQDKGRIALTEFPKLYHAHGYSDPQQLYYQREILPNVHLIGLNSNAFDANGEQIGVGLIDAEQMAWLDEQLAALSGKLVMVMVHHNVLEHLPQQSQTKLGQRYMISNAPALVERLQKAHVPVAFTGHLHVQDIEQAGNFYAVTTGSLVSYPHPYRMMSVQTDGEGVHQLCVESHRIRQVPDWPTLQETSKQWMGDRSFPFILKLLTEPPLSLSLEEAKIYAPDIRDFWANVAAGDAIFNYPNLPEKVQRYFARYDATCEEGKPRFIDNSATIALSV